MFQLESELKKWRKSLAENESIGQPEALELETHLRDSMADLSAKGLNEHEAFLVGTLRVGKAHELVAEYEKVDPQSIWRTRMLWMLGGYVAFVVAGSIISGLSSVAGLAMNIAGFGPSSIGVVALIVLVAAWSLLLYRVHIQTKKSTVVADRITSTICIWAVLGYFLSRAIAMVVAVPMFQLSNPQDMGLLSLIRGWGGSVIHIGVFVACVTLMWKFGRPQNQPEELIVD